MKNEIFSGSRFRNYFKYDFIQMWRNHVKASIGIGLSGLILYVITVGINLVFGHGWSGPGLSHRFVIFIVAGLALELYQTRTYGYLTNKKKGSAWLMLPASTFEKWLSMIIMTVIVIPLVFLGVYFISDLLVASFDPTVGHSMLQSIGNGFRDLSSEITNVNVDYATNWNIWAFVPAIFAGFCSNFLYFLLCGLVFKKNKILGAFVVLFVITSLFTIGASVFGFNTGVHVELNDFAEAEGYIRHIMNVTTWVTLLVAAVIAGGIFWRLKTLKH